ncbi:UNVERIFIED_CONTAM: hypothetical protein GTU68_033206 [Idotea baltica]|nr:hypothetical protein [Idotea baltica]
MAVVNGGDIEEGYTLSQFEGKKYVVLFFYPKDFTFVCPTELHAFEAKRAEFEKRDTQLIAVSTDSEFSHWAWLNTPKGKGGIEGIQYPLVADLDKTISTNYGVLAGGDPVAYRGLFLIDKTGKVRHQLVNDMPLGRNVDEALRMVDALQHFEDKGEVCPANWSEGEEALNATSEGVATYLNKH